MFSSLLGCAVANGPLYEAAATPARPPEADRRATTTTPDGKIAPRAHELAERAGREARGGGRIEGRRRGERPPDRGEHALAAAHRLRGEDVRRGRARGETPFHAIVTEDGAIFIKVMIVERR